MPRVRRMNTPALGALIFAVLAAPNIFAAEIVVIVNPAAKLLSKDQIADLYLGRGGGLTPIDQTAGSAIYVEFYKKATGRDVAQVKAIWSRILFNGRGLPPKQLPDSAAVKRAVAADPNAVGYIEKSAADTSVKVVLPLD
jgi:ABC-type phosphate transport system substrate-binding protein